MKKHGFKRALSFLLTLTLVVGILPVYTLNFAPKAQAYGSHTRQYNGYYYYTNGTKFYYKAGLYYSSSSNEDAENNIRNRGYTPVGTNFNAGDKNDSKYVHLGIATTTDPTVAIKSFRCDFKDSAPDTKNSSVYDIWAETAADTSVSYRKIGTYINSSNKTSAEVTTDDAMDGAVDLNKGNGGDDIKLYATKDCNAGPAITGISMVNSRNTSNLKQSLSDGRYTPVTSFQNTFDSSKAVYFDGETNGSSDIYDYVLDLNSGCGGGGNWNYMGYISSCVSLKVKRLYEAYKYANDCYANGGSMYSGLNSALSTANTILNDLDDGYTCTYTQANIDDATRALFDAMPAAELNTEYTANFTVANMRRFWKFTPSTTGDYVFFCTNTGSDGSPDPRAAIWREDLLYGYNATKGHTDFTSKDLLIDIPQVFAGAGSSGSYTDFWTVSLPGPYHEGEQFTVEFETKGSGTLYTYFYGQYDGSTPIYLQCAKAVSSAGNETTNTDGAITTPLSSSYTSYKITWTLSGNGNPNAYKTVLFRVLDGSSAEVKNVKFYRQTEEYVGYNDDVGGGKVSSLLGMGSNKFFATANLTAGISYILDARPYYTGTTGSVNVKICKLVNIKFNSTGGTGDDNYNLPAGHTMDLSQIDVSRSDHTLLAWSTQATSNEPKSCMASDTVTIPDSATTYYALWYPNSPTVMTVNSSYTSNVDVASKINFYSFTPSSSGTYLIYSNSTSTGNADPYLIVYKASDYSSNASQLWTDDDGGNSHHDFVGSANRNFYKEMTLEANTQYLFGVKAYHSDPGASSNSGIGNVPFRFEKVYKVNYNANGGSGAPSTQKKYYNKSLTLSAAAPSTVKSGCHFLGWATSSTATSANSSYNNGSSYTSNADLNLYAVWEAHKGGTATCTAAGKCSVCNVEYIAALGHNQSSSWTTDANQHWKVCTRCNTITTAKADHTYGNWSNNNATTHKHTCSVCGYTATANHTWNSGSVTTQPTCTDTGVKTYTCTTANCGATKTESVAINSSAHNYGTPTYTWSADGKTCTATRVCSRSASHKETETATVDNGKITSTVTTAATCEGKGTTKYTATFTNTAFATQTKSVQDIAALGHNYGTPTYSWSDDGSSCTATRVCSRNSSHKETENATVTSAVKTAATCTAMGTTTYTATFTNSAFATQTKDVQDIAKLGHNYGTPTYSWSDDGSSCTATRVCSRNSSHTETETATVANGKITASVTTAATCEGKGTTKYTATFTNSAFTSQTKSVQDIAKLGHNYGTPTYTWSTDGKTCTATRVCSRNSSHTETETATVSNGKITASVTTAATCEGKGTTKYTATFTNTAFASQTKSIQDIAKLGHNYGTPTYSWSDDGSSCTATRVCSRNSSHKETENATVASAVKTAATCTAMGTTTYTATFTNSAFATQTKDVQDIAKLGHSYDYDSAVFNWSGYTCATATATCSRDSSHKDSQATTVTSVTTPASTTAAGKTVYTATFTVGSKTYTDTKTETLAQLTVKVTIRSEGSDDTVDNGYYTRTKTLTAPAARDGYTFTGWTVTSGNGSVSGSTFTYGSTDTVVSAVWRAHTCTVKFDKGIGTGSMSDQTFTYGEAAKALTANGFTAPSYTVSFNSNGGTTSNSLTATGSFKDWSGSNGKTYTNKQQLQNITPEDEAEITLTAQWNKGSITLPTPTKDNYVIEGWYSDSGLNTKVGNAGAPYTPTASGTLYAKWADISATDSEVNGAYAASTTITTTKPLFEAKLTKPDDLVLNSKAYTTAQLNSPVSGTKTFVGTDGVFTVNSSNKTIFFDPAVSWHSAATIYYGQQTTVNSTPYYTYAKYVATPDTNLSFNETKLTKDGAWTTETSTVSSVNNADSTAYGFDARYKTKSLYSDGTAYKVNVSKNTTGAWPTMSFDFWGTGVDIIGRCDATTGLITAKVMQYNTENVVIVNGKKMTAAINTYYKDGTYSALCQTPVVHFDGLPYAHYTVLITASYSAFFDKTGTQSFGDIELDGIDEAETANERYSGPDLAKLLGDSDFAGVEVQSVMPDEPAFNVAGNAAGSGSYNVFVDGIRIYNPAGVNLSSANGIGKTYADDNELNPTYTLMSTNIRTNTSAQAISLNGQIGSIYVEQGEQGSGLAAYNKAGPLNEVYLTTNQTVAFKVASYSSSTKVHVALRNVSQTGAPKASINSGAALVINSNTEMYYDVSAQVTGQGIVTITNTGSGLLGIGNVKIIRSGASSQSTGDIELDGFEIELDSTEPAGAEIYVDAETLEYALSAAPTANSMPDAENVTFPVTFVKANGERVTASVTVPATKFNYSQKADGTWVAIANLKVSDALITKAMKEAGLEDYEASTEDGRVYLTARAKSGEWQAQAAEINVTLNKQERTNRWIDLLALIRQILTHLFSLILLK